MLSFERLRCTDVADVVDVADLRVLRDKVGLERVFRRLTAAKIAAGLDATVQPAGRWLHPNTMRKRPADGTKTQPGNLEGHVCWVCLGVFAWKRSTEHCKQPVLRSDTSQGSTVRVASISSPGKRR